MTVGRLTLVGTPIGNLADISRRAIDTLATAEVAFCEDTRRARKLYSALGLPAPRLVRLDANNETGGAGAVAAAVGAGRQVVLLTDAGMPSVADPGAAAVRAVVATGGRVEVAPGPSAVSTALAVSGLPADRYRFAGFLPRKGPERAAAIGTVATATETTVIYEAPTRVTRTVGELAGACGPGREFVAARELTKLHEEVWRGTLGLAVEWLASQPEAPRGEWVLLVGPLGEEAATRHDDEIVAALRERLAAGGDRRSAVAEVAAALRVPKRRVYDLGLTLKAGP